LKKSIFSFTIIKKVTKYITFSNNNKEKMKKISILCLISMLMSTSAFSKDDCFANSDCKKGFQCELGQGACSNNNKNNCIVHYCIELKKVPVQKNTIGEKYNLPKPNPFTKQIPPDTNALNSILK
jgi:hypothetical protein